MTIYSIDPILFVVVYLLVMVVILTVYTGIRIIFYHPNDNGLRYTSDLYNGNIIVYTQGGRQSK